MAKPPLLMELKLYAESKDIKTQDDLRFVKTTLMSLPFSTMLYFRLTVKLVLYLICQKNIIWSGLHNNNNCQINAQWYSISNTPPQLLLVESTF